MLGFFREVWAYINEGYLVLREYLTNNQGTL